MFRSGQKTDDTHTACFVIGKHDEVNSPSLFAILAPLPLLQHNCCNNSGSLFAVCLILWLVSLFII